MNYTNPTRPNFRSITPYLAVDNAMQAHDFYHRAFDAEIVARLRTPDGHVAYGALRIGDSMIVVVDEMESVGLRSPRNGGTCSIVLSVSDADMLFVRAVNEGAQPIVPVAPSFAGERHGLLLCPFGHRWIISTRTDDLSDDEITKRWEKLFEA